jgi:hypothetical protein
VENARDKDAAELAALRKRFPKPTNAGAAFQGATILLVNGYLVYLVAIGQLSPVGIAAFNLAELIVLSVIAHLALLAVPKASRLSDAQSGSLVQKIVMMALGLAYLGGVYSFSVSIDKIHIEQLRQAPSLLDAFWSLNIAIPLLLTSLATAFATFNDLARWRGKGGIFVPQYAMSGAPKILTLIVAPIPAGLIGASYAKADLATGLIVWCAVYIGIKTLFEFLILAFQYFGMPEAKPKRHARS